MAPDVMGETLTLAEQPRNLQSPRKSWPHTYTANPFTIFMNRHMLQQLLSQHPQLWLGLCVSVYGTAIGVEGLGAKLGLRGKNRELSWDVIVFGFAVSAFFFWTVAALRP